MQTMSTMLDSMSLDFDIPPTMSIQQLNPKPPETTQQLSSKPPVTNSVKSMPKNPVKTIPKNQILSNKSLGFSNLPDLPSVPTDIPTGDIKEKDDDDDEETDFDELLNRFEDLKKNKK